MLINNEAELIDWPLASSRIPAVEKTAHKYDRGLVEIRAGSTGATGAALLASKGAQAAGAGLVRLIVDASIYPLIVPACSGVMAVPGGMPGEDKRFSPSAILLGPGWGKSEDRKKIFESCLPLEKQGTPLILDADAIPFVRSTVFNGNTIITPHASEFSALSGIPKEKLTNPVEILKSYAADKNIHILFKSHVMYIVSPDGRTAVTDGMNPVLAAGGSGDILAGFCAAIAARTACKKSFDGFACACAAASLLISAAKDKSVAERFIDPAELLLPASRIAGGAWLSNQ
jgi:NAD(P)H-hydrate epimerase